MVSFISKLLLVAFSLQTVGNVPKPLFVQEGKSVILMVNNSLNPNHVFWVFTGNKTCEFVRYFPRHPKHRRLRVEASYRDRVELDNSTFSLKLKNVTMSDSGLYRGEIGTAEGDHVAEFRLSVYEPVISPILTVLSNWSSSNCNVTLTCRGCDLSVNFTCNSNTCSVIGGAPDPAFIVFIKDDHIICNHSNPVSWSHVTVKLEQYCLVHKAGGAEYSYISFPLWIRISTGLLIVGSSALLCYCFLPRRSQNLWPTDKDESPQSCIRLRTITNL